MTRNVTCWFAWLLPLLLAVFVFPIVAGGTEVAVMLDPTFQISNDGIHRRPPSTDDYIDRFVSTVRATIVLGPLVAFPSLIATMFVIVYARTPRVLSIAAAVGVGALTGLLISLVIWVIFGWLGTAVSFGFRRHWYGSGVWLGFGSSSQMRAETWSGAVSASLF